MDPAKPSDFLPAVGGILTAGASLIGQGVQNQRQAKLIREQNARDLEMWNLQNKYNLPINQVARLKEAGLNPALMYGTGSGANTADAPQASKAPDYKLNVNEGIGSGMNMIGQYMQIKQGQAGIDNTQADTANKKLDAGLKALEATILEERAKELGINIQNKTFDLGLKQSLRPYNVEMGSLGVQKRKEEINNLLSMHTTRDKESFFRQLLMEQQHDTGFLSQENIRANTANTRQNTINARQQNLIAIQEEIFKKYENQLREKGLTSSDSPILRFIARTMENGGISLKDVQDGMGKLINKLTNWDSSKSSFLQWLHNNSPSKWFE